MVELRRGIPGPEELGKSVEKPDVAEVSTNQETDHERPVQSPDIQFPRRDNNETSSAGVPESEREVDYAAKTGGAPVNRPITLEDAKGRASFESLTDLEDQIGGIIESNGGGL